MLNLLGGSWEIIAGLIGIVAVTLSGFMGNRRGRKIQRLEDQNVDQSEALELRKQLSRKDMENETLRSKVSSGDVMRADLEQRLRDAENAASTRGKKPAVRKARSKNTAAKSKSK